MNKLITPKYGIIPSVFLAGPVRGAINWQREVIDCLYKHTECRIDIFNPRVDSTIDEDFTEEEQAVQTAWETYYLNKADIIAFYLPAPAENAGRHYAKASRFELGEWAAKHKQLNKRLVVTMADDFPGNTYLRQKLAEYNVEIKGKTLLDYELAIVAECHIIKGK